MRQLRHGEQATQDEDRKWHARSESVGGDNRREFRHRTTQLRYFRDSPNRERISAVCLLLAAVVLAAIARQVGAPTSCPLAVRFGLVPVRRI
jgi:hypothetical protein